MNRRQASIALALGAGAAGLALLRSGLARHAAPPDRPRQSLLIGGAGAMLSLNNSWARAFALAYPTVDIVIETGGSLPAYIAASSGAIDLAAMTRGLSDAEDSASAHQFLVAKGEIAIIVHRGSRLADLSRQQVAALLSGDIDNWRKVGGPNRAVHVYAHTRGGVARRFAEEYLLDGNDFTPAAGEFDTDSALVAAVAADPDGIGAVAARAQLVAPHASCVAIDRVRATRSTVLSGRYPYAHSFHLLLFGESNGPRADFLDFARSPAGQDIVSKAGLMPVC